MAGFLKPNAISVFDSEFDLLGQARGQLYSLCRKRNLPGGPLWNFLLSEALLVGDEGDYVAFTSFPVNDVRLYGRAVISFRAPHLGALAKVPLACHEISNFVQLWQLRISLKRSDYIRAAQVMPLGLRCDVMHEIGALKSRGYRALLACYCGDNDELANAVA